jgi:hypothetical protein
VEVEASCSSNNKFIVSIGGMCKSRYMFWFLPSINQAITATAWMLEEQSVVIIWVLNLLDILVLYGAAWAESIRIVVL